MASFKDRSWSFKSTLLMELSEEGMAMIHLNWPVWELDEMVERVGRYELTVNQRRVSQTWSRGMCWKHIHTLEHKVMLKHSLASDSRY
ncbi:MAG: hypothetical protein M1840_005151 [Geoglossum simile]|nr:MAG: hypothetical protein M1840_005151 [Geoglossum simile]